MKLETITLNVGLNRNNGTEAVTRAEALQVLHNLFDADKQGFARGHRVAASDTEDTLVIAYEANIEILEPFLHAACSWLNQDCIAVQFQDGTGKLVGPAPENFGWVFDPAQFLPLEAV